MNRYSKMFLSLLLASAAVFFIFGITTGQAFAVFQDDADEVGYTEEEYAAWEAADKEADIVKSGAMLIEFINENPKSKLSPYAEGSYMRLLNRCVQEKKYQELETLAEQWNSFKPGDDNIVRMIAVSAKELNHTEKYVQTLEEIYKKTPDLNFAKELAGLYKEMKNDDKYIEWTITIMKTPEEASNFLLHYELFQHYSNKKDSAKIIEYAQSTLKAIDQTKNSPADTAKLMLDIRHNLNHTIGVMYLNDKRYDNAITYFLNALKAKKYADGYYQIAQCLSMQNKPLNAIYAYAKAQQQGESAQASAADKSVATRAKERMETVYKAMQNNTLVGIQNRYKRAESMSDEELIKPMD